jgi:predicted GNAT family acetyltransferase
MRLVTYATAAEFLAAVGPTLAEHEAEHHLVLGVAEGAATGHAPNDNMFLASVHDADGLALAALMTHGYPLLLASDRADVTAASALLWDTLGAEHRLPKLVIGAVGQVEVAVEQLTRASGGIAQVAMRQRSYKLTSLDAPPPTSGNLRVATSDDLDLVAQWVSRFEAEALANIGTRSTKASAARRITAGEIHLWCDPDPRTMAASVRPTKRAIAVAGVYTPPEWRRRGYATACVAAVSERLLQRGFELCVLYTDLSNPTSNSIYTRIGYRPLRDFLMFDLSAESPHG